MKALFGVGPSIAFSRVLREHRAALIPLAIVLTINVAVLGLVVLPLSQRVATNESRAQAAERAQGLAAAEFKQAENLREGKTRAVADLETFYAKVLPADFATARRMIQIKFQQKAREHNVRFQRAATNDEELQDSVLNRLTLTMNLSGDYDDFRALLYELETSPDFFVIDNVALTEGGELNAPLSVALDVSTYFRSARTVQLRVGANGR